MKETLEKQKKSPLTIHAFVSFYGKTMEDNYMLTFRLTRDMAVPHLIPKALLHSEKLRYQQCHIGYNSLTVSHLKLILG